MLIERTFTIGGGICIGLAISFIGSVVALGSEAWPLLLPSVLFTGFGAFFVYVGRDARRERLELLHLGEPTSKGRNPGQPRV